MMITSESSTTKPFDYRERPKLRHVLRSSQFDLPFLNYLFSLTNAIRRFNKSKEGLNYLSSLLSHKRVMLYFTQPSTRTFLSFQSACHILGAFTSEIRDPTISSEAKGESVEDSLRTFSSYVDLIIMRSPIPGLCDRIASLLDTTSRPVPVINAGSGPDEHPTQALLDLYTLYRAFAHMGGIAGKKICLVGDLRRGRTVRSLSLLLAQYPGVKLYFCSPQEFSIGNDIKQQLAGVEFVESNQFEECIAAADAVYMTRIQDEYDTHNESRHINIDQFSFQRKHLAIIKDHCVILHPMPRRTEISPLIDQDPRARYFRQERNGMWIRVALLTLIFRVDNKVLLPDL